MAPKPERGIGNPVRMVRDVERAEGYQPPGQSENPKPRIVVEFEAPGSIIHTVTIAGVSHEQVYLASWLLDAMARELRASWLAAQAPRRLTIPPPGRMTRGR